jgi:rubrerythrin
MNKEERLNAIEVAIANEMRERAFYLNHALKTRHPLGKAMFEQLAVEELEHAERLKEVHKKWERLDKWPETIPLKVKDTVVKDILLKVVKESEKAPVGDADDLEAIRTAVEFEAQGVKAYVALADAVSDPHEKAFFDLLSMIEHEHYQSLRDAEEYLGDPDSWYRGTEHRTFDGE